MPALPAVPSVVRCSVEALINAASPAVSRFFIQYTGTAPTNAQLNTFAASISTAWGTNLKALTDTSTELFHVDAIDLTSATAAVGSNSTTTLGTRAGSQLDAAACAVVSYKIGRRYRGGHPRGYWRFGVQADLSGARIWTVGFTTAVKTGIDAFYTAIEGAGWAGAGTLTQVNVSYYKGFTVITNPLTGRARNVPTLRAVPVVDLVTSTVAQSSVGIQRRRVEFVD